MLLPNRHGSTDDYRYGFGGQEKDDEIKGEGNSINYKYRMHDPRVVRFFAVDPLAKKYPYYSPYSFGGNTPIMAAELEGLEIGKPAYDRAKNWLQEKKDAGSWGAGVGLGLLKTATLEGIGDQLKETVVTLINNPPPPKPLKEALFFPAFEFYHMGEQVVDTAERAIDGDGEALVNLVVDIGGTFIGITETRLAIKTAKAEAKALQSQLKASINKVDLMGGKKATDGYVNFDLDAAEGIADDVANFNKHFDAGSLDEILVNNPRAEFLPQVTSSLKKGGTITIRGTMSNKYFNKIFNGKAGGLEGYKVVNKLENVPNQGYRQTGGEKPVTGQINEITLEKL